MPRDNKQFEILSSREIKWNKKNKCEKNNIETKRQPKGYKKNERKKKY